MVRVTVVVVVALAAVLPCACGGRTHETAPSAVSDAGGGGGRDGAPSTAPDAARDVGGPWLPPPGPYDCQTTGGSTTPTKGNGQCAPPPAATPAFCYNACWDTPGAPGPEQCRPSAADEIGSRCCVPGVCGFDFGKGCTGTYLELANENVVAPSPCAPPSATPERLFEGIIDRALVVPDSVVVAELNGLEGKVTTVSKSDCAARERYSGGRVMDAAMAGDVLYVVGADSASGYADLVSVSQAGAVKQVDLAALFGGRSMYVNALATWGTSVYATVTAIESDVTTTDPALVELPCCGSAPRLVAEGLSSWAGGGDHAVADGQNLVVASHAIIPDVGSESRLSVFDFTTRQARLFFDRFLGSVIPFALERGRLYLARGSAIVSMGIADCSVTTIAERPKATSITALAVDRGELFWAETYDHLLGARIFMKRADGTELRLAQVGARVTWLGLDAQNVYWVRTREPKAGHALVRRLRP
jgi:hypothetical protein